MRKFPIFLILATSCLFLSNRDSIAQDAMDQSFQIKEVKASLLTTPSATGLTKTTPPGRTQSKWMDLDAEFSWKPSKEDAKNPFIEELTLEFYAMLETAQSKEVQRTLLSGKTTLVHVGENRQIHAAMYVSPRAMEQLFMGKMPPTAGPSVVSATGLVISRGGSPVATFTSKPKFKFWENPDPTTKVMAGMLLPKSKTPFANAAWDYYEQEKVDK